MIKVEYKKINYIFSINNCIEENIKKLSLSEDSILFIDKLIKGFDVNLNNKISKIMYIDERKKLVESFLNEIPSQLMIFRNHLKNCMYCNSISDFEFKYKTVKEDINRLKYINRN